MPIAVIRRVPIAKFRSVRILRFTMGSSVTSSRTTKITIAAAERVSTHRIHTAASQSSCWPLSSTTWRVASQIAMNASPQ